jgi:hypothetical protein
VIEYPQSYCVSCTVDSIHRTTYSSHDSLVTSSRRPSRQSAVCVSRCFRFRRSGRGVDPRPATGPDQRPRVPSGRPTPVRREARRVRSVGVGRVGVSRVKPDTARRTRPISVISLLTLYGVSHVTSKNNEKVRAVARAVRASPSAIPHSIAEPPPRRGLVRVYAARPGVQAVRNALAAACTYSARLSLSPSLPHSLALSLSLALLQEVEDLSDERRVIVRIVHRTVQ